MRKVIFFCLLVLSGAIKAQLSQFKKFTIKVDTLVCDMQSNSVNVSGKHHLSFNYNNEDEILAIEFETQKGYGYIDLIPSNDFKVIDSLLRVNDRYQFKIRFNNISQSEFSKLSFKSGLIDSAKKVEILQVPLLPIHNTSIQFNKMSSQLYVGEEKEFEIITNNYNNLLFSNEWKESEEFEYRFSPENGKLFVHLIPKKRGSHAFEISFKTKKPTAIKSDMLVKKTNKITYTFNVEESRLSFLEIDKRDISYNEENRLKGVEVVIQDHRLLKINRTYRIENQEKPGGVLVAELYTKSSLSNNKVLCILRPYNLHRKSEGYLYLKEGDIARFIANIDITPETQIDNIYVLREGKKWVRSNVVYPGEMIDLKIEGKGLHKSRLHFEDLIDNTSDTLIKSEDELFFKVQVPVNITKKAINIFNYGKATGKTLTINEYQEPRPFDFVVIDYGAFGRRLSDVKGPVVYEKTVNDLVITFDRDIIDIDDKFYGKQYFDIEIEVTDKFNNLIEIKELENILVMPSAASKRGKFYESEKVSSAEISLNDVIRKKTYDLEEWSRIKLKFVHVKDKYNSPVMEKEFELILKKAVKFDVDVSFPAGLLTITKVEEIDADGNPTGKQVVDYGNLGGISMAMIAQFSFYHPDKIARLRPYKVGVGFLAFNAFNFSENNTNRDVGIVAVGSLYPTTRDSKLTFPLYVGGGYFLSKEKWFFLIGPGIRVSL